MKHLALLMVLLLALRPASAQLPPPADYPGDVRLVPSPGAPFLRWTSTGPAYWNVEHSTDLQTWSLLQSTRETSAAGALVERGVSAVPGQPMIYYRLTHLKELPVITREPADVTIHAQSGESFGLNAGASGAPPLIHRWYWNATLIAAFTNQELSSLEGQTLGGSYQMVAANPWGSATSRVAVVTALPPPPPPPPSIVSQPQDVTRLEGQTFEMSATVSGFNPLINRWYRDGVLIASSTNNLHPTLTNLTLGGAYQLIVSNVGGMATSRVAIATIKPSPNFAPESIAGRLLELNVSWGSFESEFPALYRLRPASTGDTYDLQGLILKPDSTGTYTYLRKDGANAELTIMDSNLLKRTGPFTFTSPTNGTFILYYDGGNRFTSGIFTLTVEPPTIPARILVQPADVTVYAGRSFSFAAYTEGTFPLVQRWYRDGGLVATFTNVQKVSLTNQTLAGAYQLISSNAWGMATSRVAIATVKPVPDYAPASLAGRLLEMHSLNNMFRSSNRILLKTAFVDSTYTVRDKINNDSQLMSQGVYTYERVDGIAAVAVFEDSRAGTVTVRFEYSSPNAGTFTITAAATPNRVDTGDFSYTN